MSRTLATAYHKATEEVCDVVSVQGGEWLLVGQWTGQEHTVLETANIDAVWPHSDVVENVQDMIDAGFHLYEVFRMIEIISNNSEWAQIVVKVWADLY